MDIGETILEIHETISVCVTSAAETVSNRLKRMQGT